MGVLAAARSVLLTADPREKAMKARQMQEKWLSQPDIGDPSNDLPEQPARPDLPVLVAPSEVPRRRLGSPQGLSLIHI